MRTKGAFARALKQARNIRGLTQEDFSDVSSRTYISTLERGLKSPTIDKIEDLATILCVHPLSLIALGYLFESPDQTVSEMFIQIKKELQELKANI